MTQLDKTMARLERTVKEKDDSTPKQLPIWAEELRGAPNEVIRSSLFTGRRNGPREHFSDAVLFVLGDGEVTYRGEELRTFDEDVWLQVMHLARLQPLGEWVEFTPYAFIKEIGWVKGKVNPSKLHYDRLQECLSRMQATTILVRSKRLKEPGGHSVSLIRKFRHKGASGKNACWQIWIEPEMKTLFGDVHYTQVEWEQRSRLSPTAKRIHGYYASHKAPYPVKIESLHKICKLKATLSGFKQKLPKYLGQMVEEGFLDHYDIGGNIVTVQRAKLS